MTSPAYLEYEVALLLAKYGKNAVLNALAKKMELSQEELESQLKDIPSKKAPARSRKGVAAADSMEEVIREHPAKEQALRALQRRFENRRFLPELRDVRQFFEQHSRSLGSIKSRAESFRRLFSLLAELDLPDLDALCQDDTGSGHSSLGVISDEILRRDQALTNR